MTGNGLPLAFMGDKAQHHIDGCCNPLISPFTDGVPVINNPHITTMDNQYQVYKIDIDKHILYVYLSI